MARLTGNFPYALDARVNKYFFQNLAAWPKEYPAWCMVQSSTDPDVRMSAASELPMPGAVGENETFPETRFVEGPLQTINWTKYGFRLIASEELIDDNLFGLLDKAAAACGRALAHRLETQGAYDLVNSFTGTWLTVNGSAEYLCQENHAAWTNSGGNTQSNMPSTDVTLGVDSLWAAVNNFAGLEDNAGNPAMEIADELIIEATNKRTAVEVLRSDKVAYKSTNTMNAIRDEGLTYKIGHYLTSTTAWWVRSRRKPVYFYFRWQPRVQVENTISTQSRAWQISCRIGHAAYDWRPLYGTDGAA